METKRRKRRKVYKKLNKEELNELYTKEECKYYETGIIKKAGNEGDTHLCKKIDIAIKLHNVYSKDFRKDCDGVYFEYPIISTDSENKLSPYQKNKFSYLKKMYQKINVESGDECFYIKNLYNIFNCNLKSRLRGRKCVRSLHIEKIVDIAVVVNSEVKKVVEVVVSNKLSKKNITFFENECINYEVL